MLPPILYPIIPGYNLSNLRSSKRSRIWVISRFGILGPFDHNGTTPANQIYYKRGFQVSSPSSQNLLDASSTRWRFPLHATPLEKPCHSLQSSFYETYECCESFGVPASPNVLGLPQSLCIPSESSFFLCNHLPSLKTTPVHNTAESAFLYTITLNHVHVYARVCIAY